RQVILTPKKVEKIILEKHILDRTPDNLVGVLQHIVSGAVNDHQGQPLPGASIVEKGTTNGAQTDFDGNFSLVVGSENAVLVVSYLGFATKEIPVNRQTIISISLVEDAAGLNEVVVIGYGKQTKATLTGAIATADLKSLEKAPSVNLSNT